MKIAYIILAYNNPIHFHHLLDALDTKDNDLYVHVDKKTRIDDFLVLHKKNIYFEENRHSVYWGEFSQVEAVLKLLNVAVKKRHDYYILLYGSDYPIRSQRYIKEYLKKNQGSEFMNLAVMPEMDKTLDRIDYYRFLQANRNSSVLAIIKRSLNQLIRIFNLKRNLPHAYKNFTLYGGCPWWILTEESIKYALSFIDKNPSFLDFWRHTLIPDETFFHTILGNSKYRKNIRFSLMYTRWNKGKPNPEIINDYDIEVIKAKKHDRYNNRDDVLFARKFDNSSLETINNIHKKLYAKDINNNNRKK
jgi:hypothetical protein